ncbi:hypothetical protein CGCSCA4_v005957 [Colletotrichum siamense]|uniref:HNH nuclease domain-containing protein n=1 Tax=Colletotrichum siamense TaxID=690259 RepID=A0A9P5EJ57_COLSI|nr:hypothetical protein CGCSCA4_v005957 [Colletotrichum siamense]KAF4849285.1 hypothetical protein CGCSCA2_v011946 [Colletotrichum siamense]
MGRNVSYLNEDEIDIRRRYISEIQLILLTDESIWVLNRLASIHQTLTRNDDDPNLPSAKLYLATDIKSAALNAHAYVGYATCRADQVDDKTENITRNESAAKKAGDRDDNKCVATGCNKIQICHFAAVFGISRKLAIRWVLHYMKVFIGPQAFRDLEVKLIGSGTIIDTPSNMVTLTHELHKYMDDAIFGLEPVNYISRPKPELNALSGESNAQGINTGPATGDSRTQGHAELQTGDVNLVASVESPIQESERLMESDLKRKAEAEAEANRIRAREEEKKAEESRRNEATRSGDTLSLATKDQPQMPVGQGRRLWSRPEGDDGRMVSREL